MFKKISASVFAVCLMFMCMSSLPCTAYAKANKETVSSQIDINKADVAALTQITGIGPSLAARIIKYREENGSFEVVEDLMKVKGIGPKKFMKIKAQLSI